MQKDNVPRVLVLCTVSAGLDSIAEVLRSGYQIQAIVGVDPNVADSEVISGYTDVALFAKKWGIRSRYVQSYELKNSDDQKLLSGMDFDLLWVAGWQRLVPGWLIKKAGMRVLGGHGSPDGIQGGRGRSPQNWALLLGCKRFDLSLFKITAGVDEGPVIAQRSFFYNETDDIAISYRKAALCMGEMMVEVMKKPKLLEDAVPQSGDAYYYPQRKPEDGYIDWYLTQREIWAHCRALTHPYPGLRTSYEEADIILWDCLPFDDSLRSAPGTIDVVFEDGSFLVGCRDGRVLVKQYSSSGSWEPDQSMVFRNNLYKETLRVIVERHSEKYPDAPIARRIMNGIEGDE